MAGKRSSYLLGALSFLVIGCNQTLNTSTALNLKTTTLQKNRDTFLEEVANYEHIGEIPGIPQEIRDAYPDSKSGITEFYDFEEQNQG